MPAPKSKPIDPWAAVDRLLAKEVEPTSPGWFTLYDFAERYKMSRTGAQDKLRRMVEAGTLELWKGRSVAAGGAVIKKYRVRGTA